MRAIIRTAGVLLLAAALLAVPWPDADLAPAPPRGGAFAWQSDSLWVLLEQQYRTARETGCPTLDLNIGAGLDRISHLIDGLAGDQHLPPEAPQLDFLEAAWFAVTPLVAACPDHQVGYAARYRALRTAIKQQSRHWDVSARPARDRLYRALYGSRAALEEVLLQHPDRMTPLLLGVDEPSATPSAVVEGVRIHSGDMLVSRGGAPTSALIARGNDYPGNFSHVALVHVDSTGAASTVEAHIEVGVAIGSAEQYLKDKKLRIMVLRPRADLPALVADPMLPHRAATAAIERVRAGHIPYDFAMDYHDPSKLFCSEVASSAYRNLGVTLWTGLSTLSAEGLRRWLSSFGVSHFETQEPSDLEYDPQLVVVAEWRGPETLRDDHIDNAVIDAMLEGAERGDRLSYSWYQLPVARVLKAWSWIRVQLGGTGPVPEGMSAASALRNKAFTARQKALAAQVRSAADLFSVQEGYPAPYWRLLDLAREAVAAVRRPAAPLNGLAVERIPMYHDIMRQRHDRTKTGRVAEPVQVYLDPPARERLERLAAQLDATKSDVLRRGLEALESLTGRPTQAPSSPPPLPTYAGLGLQPGVDLDDTASLLDLMGEGSGDAAG